MENSLPANGTENFKKAMRRLTATVALITTSDKGVPFGMAATAICSIGVNPPSLLVSIAHTATMHDPLINSRRFCVNLLSREHAHIVGPFSGKLKGAARFEIGEWTEGYGEVPVLVDAQASVICEIANVFEHSGHTLVIGIVVETRVREEVMPLLYENGGFAHSVAIA
ncbi:flavin reductase family protein [Brucella intermedia GD04153]|uniref:Flavin reductase family protein n=1 Tax=Brucella intermedia GD04153 TaxID=2975438 RepID=A0AA42KUL0_9HYPH|nr:flavin reductase family protein [Brucella intermedia]MDH0127105.1 flavin reductase family protein [Brucella intermedia GD04153]RRD21401.1 flavin reductase [Brucellaceae bacterium VT-16-1752]